MNTNRDPFLSRVRRDDSELCQSISKDVTSKQIKKKIKQGYSIRRKKRANLIE